MSQSITIIEQNTEKIKNKTQNITWFRQKLHHLVQWIKPRTGLVSILIIVYHLQGLCIMSLDVVNNQSVKWSCKV